MRDKITRRDFLNGTQVAVGASLLSPWIDVFGAGASASGWLPDYYPPARTGLRGSHDGAWETMHARVAGASWPSSAPEEEVDLVVVGGGISGLAAAHFYREGTAGRAHPRPRQPRRLRRPCQAQRVRGRRPHPDRLRRHRVDRHAARPIRKSRRELLRDIGIDVERFLRVLRPGTLRLDETLVRDRLRPGDLWRGPGWCAATGAVPWAEFAAQTPLNERAQADLVRLFTEERDYLPGMSRDEKVAYLGSISYRSYLEDRPARSTSRSSRCTSAGA